MIDHSLASLDPYLDAYMPALIVDAAGNVIVVYNGSGNNVGPPFYEPQWASVYVTGRRPTDPLGTVRPPRLLRAGEASFWDGLGIPGLPSEAILTGGEITLEYLLMGRIPWTPSSLASTRYRPCFPLTRGRTRPSGGVRGCNGSITLSIHHELGG